MKKIYNNKQIIITGSIFLISLLGGCQKQNSNTAKANIIQSIPVKVMKVLLTDVNQTLDYVGSIKAQNEIIVYPKISGKILEKVKQEGDLVKKGEAIAYVDRDEVGLKFEKAVIESPINGVVGKIYVDIGSNVNLTTPIALIVDMEKIKINLEIPENYLSKISLRQDAKIAIDAYAGEVFVGKVSKISPVLNTDTRAAAIEIIIDNNNHRLKSGMFARVSLIIDIRKSVPVAMKESIMGRGDNFSVYVIENQKAVLRKITPGLRQGEFYEIKDGVNADDLVVIMGQQKLFDGADVSVEEENK